MINRKKYHLLKGVFVVNQDKTIIYLCGLSEKSNYAKSIGKYPKAHHGICKKCEKKANEIN